MNKFLSKYPRLFSLDMLVTVVLSLFIYFFWLLLFPQALSYQEQYQLFLWTGDYALESMKLPGGLACYVGEFFTQFYIYEVLGALILAVLFALLLSVIKVNIVPKTSVNRALLACVPTLLVLMYMGDESVMLSYLIAMIVSLLLAALMKKVNILYDLIVVPLIYWMIGPMVWLYLIIRIFSVGKKDWWKALGMVVYLVFIQLLTYNIVLKQWTLTDTFYGIGYYRQPTFYPLMGFFAPAVVVFVVVMSKFKEPVNFGAKINNIILVLVSIVCAYQAYKSFDKEKYELIKQDYLIRHERWDDVIRSAEKYCVPVNFWSESVNLSLAMTGQLSQRMFSFYQNGQDALIMPMVRDLTSNLPTMEAFYRLGMTNECLRYAFDLQESIPYGKRSGRLSKRIIECCLVSGRYDVAQKHLDLLKKSLFYSTWAKNTEKYVGNEAMIDTHPVYGKMRRNKFGVDFLFYYPELTKIFYHLFMSNTDNKMALEYMLGQALLEGDANLFMQLVGAVNQFGGYSGMPYTYQDAINCIQARGNAPGSRYGEYAKRMKQGKNSENELTNTESVH